MVCHVGMPDLLQRDFSAVIFDVDGTLADSARSLGRVWQTWLSEYEVVPPEGLNLNGMTNPAIVALALPQADSSELARAVDRVHELEIQHADLTTALPGAVAALSALAEAPTALATSAFRHIAAGRLGAAGIVVPSVVVTGDDVTRGKPDPEIFQLAAQRLGFSPADCLVVEDAPAGIQAARAGGFPCLGVLTTSRAADLPADLLVQDLSHVRFTVADSRVRLAVA